MRLKVDVDEAEKEEKDKTIIKLPSYTKNGTFQKIRIHAHFNQMRSVHQKWHFYSDPRLSWYKLTVFLRS